jgi:hypothetical protein
MARHGSLKQVFAIVFRSDECLDWQPRLRGVGFGLLRTISSGRIVPDMDELPQPAHDSHQAHVDR